MKKIKLCVAGLLLSGMSYGQTNDTTYISVFDLDSISISEFEAWEMVNTIDYVLKQQGKDEFNVYLILIRNKLKTRLND